MDARRVLAVVSPRRAAPPTATDLARELALAELLHDRDVVQDLRPGPVRCDVDRRPRLRRMGVRSAP